MRTAASAPSGDSLGENEQTAGVPLQQPGITEDDVEPTGTLPRSCGAEEFQTTECRRDAMGQVACATGPQEQAAVLVAHSCAASSTAPDVRRRCSTRAGSAARIAFVSMVHITVYAAQIFFLVILFLSGRYKIFAGLLLVHAVGCGICFYAAFCEISFTIRTASDAPQALDRRQFTVGFIRILLQLLALFPLGLLQLICFKFAWAHYQGAKAAVFHALDQAVGSPTGPQAGTVTGHWSVRQASPRELPGTSERSSSTASSTLHPASLSTTAKQDSPICACKGTDGVAECTVFAAALLYFVGLRDEQVAKAFGDAYTDLIGTLLRIMLVIFASSAALAVVHADREAAKCCRIFHDLYFPSVALTVHFLFRLSEIVSRLWALAMLYIISQGLDVPTFALVSVVVLEYAIVIVSLRHFGEGSRAGSCGVALASMLSNVAQFMDVPRWGPTARRLSRHLASLRLLQILLVALGAAAWLAITINDEEVTGNGSRPSMLNFFPGSIALLAFAIPCTAGGGDGSASGSAVRRCLLSDRHGWLADPWLLGFHVAGLFSAVLYHVMVFGVCRRLAARAHKLGLMRASSRGDSDGLEMLLQEAMGRGGSESMLDALNFSDSDGLTPLHLAAQGGSVEAIKILLQSRAQLSSPTANTSGDTPLILAAAAGRERAVRFLLLNGALPSLSQQAHGGSGDTPLHAAIRCGHTACVHLLLRSRADMALTNRRGETGALLAATLANTGGRATGGAAAPAAGSGPALSSTDALLTQIRDSSSGPLKSSPPSCTAVPAVAATVEGNDFDMFVVEPAWEAELERLMAEARSTTTSLPSVLGSRSSEVQPASYSSTDDAAAGQLYYVPAGARPSLVFLLAAAGEGPLRRSLLRGADPHVLEGGAGEPGRSRPRAAHRPSLASFRIISVLGEGSFGIVYEVLDLRDAARRGVQGLDRRCAMKILNRRQYRRPTMQDRALQEREILKVARHPFIVRLFCAFRTAAGELAMVMELCPNGNLHDLVVKEGAPGLREGFVRKILAEILLALEHLHEKVEAIFRDLKPENVVLDVARRAKLTDFGLAKFIEEGDEGASSFVGSCRYLAPEVGPTGETLYNFSVDLYALGLVAWVCLTGGVTADGHRSGLSRCVAGAGPLSSVAARQPLETQEALAEWIAEQRLLAQRRASEQQRQKWQQHPQQHRQQHAEVYYPSQLPHAQRLQRPPQHTPHHQLPFLDERSAEAMAYGRTGIPVDFELSEHALSFMAQATAVDPRLRGSARSLRKHRLFVVGTNPPLATEEDWNQLLPPCAAPATPTNTTSTSWSWQPESY